MIKYPFFIIVFLQSLNILYAQTTIKGIVYFENDPLIGVVIKELSSDSVILSDEQGKFKISVSHDTSCIRFSCIGFKDTLVCPPFNMPLIMKMESEHYKLKEQIFLGSYNFYKGTTIGYYGGMLHNPFGFRVGNTAPYIFNIPIMLLSDVHYRTNFNDNHDFQLQISRLHGENIRKFHIGQSYTYRKFHVDDKETYIDYSSHKINLTWSFRRVGFYTGYGYSRINQINHHGVLLNFHFELPYIHTSFSSEANYWFNDIEYSFGIWHYNLFNSHLNLHAGFEQLNGYKEVNIGLRYEFSY